MRKNLHYKVLASVLAIAGLYFYNVPAAWADIQNVTENTSLWIGSGTITNNWNDNNEQISEIASVYGWFHIYGTYGDSTKKPTIMKLKSMIVR